MGTINGISKHGDGAFEGHQKQTRIKVLSVQRGCKDLVTRGHGHASKPQLFIGLCICKTCRSIPGRCIGVSKTSGLRWIILSSNTCGN